MTWGPTRPDIASISDCREMRQLIKQWRWSKLIITCVAAAKTNPQRRHKTWVNVNVSQSLGGWSYLGVRDRNGPAMTALFQFVVDVVHRMSRRMFNRKSAGSTPNWTAQFIWLRRKLMAGFVRERHGPTSRQCQPWIYIALNRKSSNVLQTLVDREKKSF